jgi:hypothetical protein
MKIRPEGSDLFHADGRTDMTKLKVNTKFCLRAQSLPGFLMIVDGQGGNMLLVALMHFL